ncbi:hypothetical protein Tco_1492738 [Tanacetum coccineum]
MSLMLNSKLDHKGVSAGLDARDAKGLHEMQTLYFKGNEVLEVVELTQWFEDGDCLSLSNCSAENQTYLLTVLYNPTFSRASNTVVECSLEEADKIVKVIVGGFAGHDPRKHTCFKPKTMQESIRNGHRVMDNITTAAKYEAEHGREYTAGSGDKKPYGVLRPGIQKGSRVGCNVVGKAVGAAKRTMSLRGTLLSWIWKTLLFMELCVRVVHDHKSVQHSRSERAENDGNDDGFELLRAVVELGSNSFVDDLIELNALIARLEAFKGCWWRCGTPLCDFREPESRDSEEAVDEEARMVFMDTQANVIRLLLANYDSYNEIENDNLGYHSEEYFDGMAMRMM